MTNRKARMTITVDAALVVAGNQAVAAGRASSLSGWVNSALEEKVAEEQRVRAMHDALAAYEAEFGVISAAEMAAQQRADKKAAIAIGGARRVTARARRRGRAA